MPLATTLFRDPGFWSCCAIIVRPESPPRRPRKEEAFRPMCMTRIVCFAALVLVLAVEPSAAQPAGGAKAAPSAGKATAPKLTKQQAKEAARQAKIEAKKSEKQAAKEAAKQAAKQERLAERKSQHGGKTATGHGQGATKVPGLAEKMGRPGSPPAPSNRGGDERGLDRAAERASEKGIEKGRAHGGAEIPAATGRPTPLKGKPAK
jgi:hypothetical protein